MMFKIVNMWHMFQNDHVLPVPCVCASATVSGLEARSSNVPSGERSDVQWVSAGSR